MKNGKPSNLFPLLKTVRHPLGNHKKAYEIHFCAGRELQFGAQRRWDNGGSSNLEQLRELVSSHVLYLTKDECLKELPPARREHKHVPVSTRQESLYNKALLELVSLFSPLFSLNAIVVISKRLTSFLHPFRQGYMPCLLLWRTAVKHY